MSAAAMPSANEVQLMLGTVELPPSESGELRLCRPVVMSFARAEVGLDSAHDELGSLPDEVDPVDLFRRFPVRTIWPHNLPIVESDCAEETIELLRRTGLSDLDVEVRPASFVIDEADVSLAVKETRRPCELGDVEVEPEMFELLL